MDARDEAAEDFEAIARELERAANHARITASHFRDRNIPSASAHIVALIGQLEFVEERIRKRTKFAATVAYVDS